MKNYSIHKIKPMHESIVKEYEALEVIRTDKNPEQTAAAHEIYRKMVAERVGFSQSYEKLPEKYACFVEVATRCAELKISLTYYMKAQFEAMDWRSGMPDPYQLIGLKADERVYKYCYENGIKLKAATPEKKIDFKALKNMM
jgi:DNA repair exonuclease SbcCD nuclease subunit